MSEKSVPKQEFLSMPPLTDSPRGQLKSTITLLSAECGFSLIKMEKCAQCDEAAYWETHLFPTTWGVRWTPPPGVEKLEMAFQ